MVHHVPSRFVGLLAGEKVTKGFKVSTFGNKTRRFFKPNVQKVYFFSDILQRRILFPVTPTAITEIDAKGGIDNYLLQTPIERLDSHWGEAWRSFLADCKAAQVSLSPSPLGEDGT